jgi:serine/threonine protein kinase
MAGVLSGASWSRWSAPWSRLKLAPGALISPRLRLVRPVIDAGAENRWVADDLALGIQVAVKFGSPRARGSEARPDVATGRALGAEARAGEGDAARFSQQVRSSAHIADPHLERIFEHGNTRAGVPFLVTELLEGKSLRQRVTYGAALSLPEAQAVTLQVASALGKAHGLRLPHGSICPDNLCLTELAGQAFIKISNFGAAAAASAAGPGDQVRSNHAYLSPEQLLLGTGADAASDLWALAVTLYELLTTTLPFEAPTSAGITVAICNAQFSPPSHYRADLTPGIDSWFARALARDPMDRFTDAYELARGFNHALASEDAGPADVSLAQAAGLEQIHEDDEEDEDERTVRWDLPRDGSLPGSISAARGVERAIPAARGVERAIPAARGVERAVPAARGVERVSPAARGVERVARAGVPGVPLDANNSWNGAALAPSRMPTYRPLVAGADMALPRSPLGVSAAAGASQRSYLASVASALTTGVARAAPSGPLVRAATRSQGPSPRLWAALFSAATLVVLFWVYKSLSGSNENRGTASRTSALSAVARHAGTSREPTQRTPAADPEDLPRIIATDQLPTAPEETDDDLAPASGSVSGSGPAPGRVAPSPARPQAARPALLQQPPLLQDTSGTAPRLNVSGKATTSANASASAPAPSGTTQNVALDNASAHESPAQNRAAQHAPAASAAVQNAPAQNVLGANAVGSPAHEPPPNAAPPAAAAPAKPPRASSSCNPPYYIDKSNIKRLKIECL